MDSSELDDRRGARLATVVLFALISYRALYHFGYAVENPLAHYPLADGEYYLSAAHDLIQAPPLGRDAFYLQGAYAALVAASLRAGAWLGVGTPAAVWGQWIVFAVACLVFDRLARALFGRRAGRWCTATLMASSSVCFYENKVLTGSIAVSTTILIIGAATRWRQRLSAPWSFSLGACAGLAALARPNAILFLPVFLGVGLIVDRRIASRNRRVLRQLVIVAVGFLLACAPMLVRNHLVTGDASLFPIHGGGTSFFIGNNPDAQGLWNSAGGRISGDLSRELREFSSLGGSDQPETANAQEVGSTLYAESIDWIASHPMDWIRLEARKIWLMLGDEELTQDHDWIGEAQLLTLPTRGLSFGMLLMLAALGGCLWRRATTDTDERFSRSDTLNSASLAMGAAAVCTIAANLLFFTSAQHRLPLIPILVLLAGPLYQRLTSEFSPLARSSQGRPEHLTTSRCWRPRAIPVAVALALFVFWPRTRQHEPTVEHDFNLAVAYERMGEHKLALALYERAHRRRPSSAVIHLQLLEVRVRRGLPVSSGALEQVLSTPGAPEWVLIRARALLAVSSDSHP